MKIESYPSIYSLGHRAVAGLLDVPVIVEEKVDGSQISFGVSTEGELRMRSKGAEIHVDHPEGMFSKGVEVVKAIQDKLTPGWVYRGEYLRQPKHNTLAYDRIPDNHIILFDISRGDGTWLSWGEKREEAERLLFEVVPLRYITEESGSLTIDIINTILDSTSVLGGQKIEGVVIKPFNYNLYGEDKKVLMGKYVSEAFKEVHGGEWRSNNPTGGDIIQQLIVKYSTPARWQKAVIHLQEAGLLEDSPKDIGLLMKEVSMDLLKEEEEEIKTALFEYAWKKINRGVTSGLPGWYKERLMERQFEEEHETQS